MVVQIIALGLTKNKIKGESYNSLQVTFVSISHIYKNLIKYVKQIERKIHSLIFPKYYAMKKYVK